MDVRKPIVLRADCRHYRGDLPCLFNRLCEGCGDYSPVDARILVIKLAATGDVVRTTCLLPGLKEAHPDAAITWMTTKAAMPLLRGNPFIDRLVSDDPKDALPLTGQRFDLLVCLDKEPWPAFLAMRIPASRKRGVGLAPEGVPIPLSPEGDYYFSLGLSDQLKFRENTRTYPELIYEAAGLPWRRQEYALALTASGEEAAGRRLEAVGLSGVAGFIGLNTGAGPVFANKGWTVDGWCDLVAALRGKHDGPVVLLGGPHEREMHAAIRERVGDLVVDLGTENPVDAFASLVSRCRVVVTGDTLGMHLAIAFKVPTVVLVGSTTHREIELYGRGEVLVSPLACAPCYRKECRKEDHCMKAITAEMVAQAIFRIIPPGGA